MIRCRCHPALADLLLPPASASSALPQWLKDMPTEVVAPTVNASVRTLKQCPPMIDAMRHGVVLFLSTDIRVDAEGFHWEWNFPALPDSALPRAPLGVHVPEQASSVPGFDHRSVLKFINHWTIETEPGYSLYCKHPANRLDLPFRTLEGLVDTDLFQDGHVHFPAQWIDPEFQGVLERGTPIAQVFPVPRDTIQLNIETQSAAQVESSRALSEALQSEKGVYRRRFRAKKG